MSLKVLPVGLERRLLGVEVAREVLVACLLALELLLTKAHALLPVGEALAKGGLVRGELAIAGLGLGLGLCIVLRVICGVSAVDEVVCQRPSVGILPRSSRVSATKLYQCVYPCRRIDPLFVSRLTCGFSCKAGPRVGKASKAI